LEIHPHTQTHIYIDNNIATEMIVGRNIIVFIFTVFIINQNTLFSDGFLIPPYHYIGYMGRNYFLCNWGYSNCFYLPQDYDYYYDCGCTDDCDYDLRDCVPESPCVTKSPSVPQTPSVPESPIVTTEENGSPGLEIPPEHTNGEHEEGENGTEPEEEEEEEEEEEDDN